jgi:hypothetical protein
MNYLSATPPPVRIVFVYGNKVKERFAVADGLSNDI